MKKNNITKWAALLLTFSGMAALPPTASAATARSITSGTSISGGALDLTAGTGASDRALEVLNADTVYTVDTFSVFNSAASSNRWGPVVLVSASATLNISAGVEVNSRSQSAQGFLVNTGGRLNVSGSVTITTSSAEATSIQMQSGGTAIFGDDVRIVRQSNYVGTAAGGALAVSGTSAFVAGDRFTVEADHGGSGSIIGASEQSSITIGRDASISVGKMGVQTASGAVISFGDNLQLSNSGSDRYSLISLSGGTIGLGNNATLNHSPDIQMIAFTGAGGMLSGTNTRINYFGTSFVIRFADGNPSLNSQVHLVTPTVTADRAVAFVTVAGGDSGGVHHVLVEGGEINMPNSPLTTVTPNLGGNTGNNLDAVFTSATITTHNLIENTTNATGTLMLTLNDADTRNAGGILIDDTNASTTNVTVNGGSGLYGSATNNGSGALNMSFNNSNWIGDITGSGSSTTTVNLNNSVLTGISAVSDNSTINLSLTNGAVWNLTGSSSVTMLSNSGTVVIANALGEDLTVSGAFTQDADGTLDVTISGTDPIVTAGTASISGTLKVSGFITGTAAEKASEIVAKNFTVIHSASGISGDFSTVDFGGAASTVDYITLTVGKTNNDRDYALNYGLSWFAASSTSHGNFTIASGSTFEIDIMLSDTAAGQGAGGWDGKLLTKKGDGLLLVSSSNNFTGGATVDSGTLRLSNLAGAGSGTVNVAQTILSVLDLSASGTYQNDTTGAGTVIISGNGVSISGTNTTFVGTWNVTGSGTMTSQNNLGVSGSTAVNIASGGALSLILGTGDYHFDQPLTGSGYLLLQNAGNVSLVPSVPLVAYVPSFTGTVELQHNTLALTAANALPLSLATLVTGTNNLVVVDSDPSATARNLGALSFSGGTIRFEGYDPHATRADTIIALTGTLNLSGGGTVEVVMPNPSQIPDGSKFTHIPLLQQDDGLALTLLISASNGVTGSPATLALRDTNGHVVSDSYTLNLSHDGVTTDAIGTYDYLLSTSAANDGLYVAFGLKQADIQPGRTLILDQDTTTPAEGDDFTATIIGSGNLQINATNAITLNGTGNAYSGTTIVNTGTLLVGINEQMFASSTAFVINSGAALNTGGFDQQVNNLSGSGLATFTNNTLTVNNSASTSFSGTLNGSVLVKDGGGQLNASDAVAHLSQVQMDNGSLLLGNNATVSASGQPAVLANGGTATFNASALSSSGSVLILAKDNSPATVNLNNLTVSVVGNFVEANNGALTVTLNDSTATGKTAVVGGGALNLGLNNSVWNLTGKSKLTTLTSSGGSITIDNVQGEDLTVSGGISGQTTLNLTLSDGVKGQQEIWVVVDETNNMSNSAFTLGREVSYGMYQYNLVNNSDGAWLVYTGSSGTTPPVNPPPINPPTISKEGDAIINTAAAVAGFWFTQLDNLHKRMGELRYNKPAGTDLINNVWVRAYGQQINANTGIYSVKGFSETQYGVDLGTDYLWKLDADNQLYTGVFAGYGGADRDFHTNYSGNTDSGYGGLYATWLNHSGWYADVVAKGQYFSNEFSGADRGDYDSVGVGFSVEFGRQFEFKDGWFAEPSVQFSYLHLMNDNYTTRDGMGVTLSDADVLHIYGGARFGRNIKLTNSGMLQPYIKAGGLGQISSGNKLTVSGDHWRPNLDGARAVVGAGLIWQLDADSQLHLDYEASFGEKYDKPWGVNFGYRYQF